MTWNWIFGVTDANRLRFSKKGLQMRLWLRGGMSLYPFASLTFFLILSVEQNSVFCLVGSFYFSLNITRGNSSLFKATKCGSPLWSWCDMRFHPWGSIKYLSIHLRATWLDYFIHFACAQGHQKVSQRKPGTCTASAGEGWRGTHNTEAKEWYTHRV